MTAQATELASGKAQSFLSSKAGFRQPNSCLSVSPAFGRSNTSLPQRGSSPSGTSRLLFYSGGSVPFGYVPTTFLLRGLSPSDTSRLLFCSGVCPFRVRPDYFSAQESVPFEYVRTTFLLSSPSPSGTSRLLFCSGVSPLRVRPDYFSAKGSVPFGSVPTLSFPAPCNPPGKTPRTLANPWGKTPRTSQVHWVGAFEPCSSFGMRSVHIANPSDMSRLHFCSGVRSLRVLPLGSVLTFTFLHQTAKPFSVSRVTSEEHKMPFSLEIHVGRSSLEKLDTGCLPYTVLAFSRLNVESTE
ncbi:hypothetical protein CRG98_020232 [Punica granatum]|uniref:Uncharacterized protein n=1 Tax=Punica granatum TaxID=22663 RepID=A0A2I0JSU0_PUNGR|nr:hypothetical protein CRG98_020232 [Punica granatum]